MEHERTGWATLTNYGSGFEADLVVERLRSAGILATTRGNDIVGIVGAGFQGTTARGVDVLVAARDLDAARALLEEDDDTGDVDDVDDVDSEKGDDA
jgi:putative signal transducing protein